jgi:hypothetical protein
MVILITTLALNMTDNDYSLYLHIIVVGAWKDFSAAGYLLANAFRRSSATPPDSLPSVQKWKSYAAAVEAMAQSLKKKDAAAALRIYDAALVKLDDYLTQAVELPGLKEL